MIESKRTRAALAPGQTCEMLRFVWCKENYFGYDSNVMRTRVISQKQKLDQTPLEPVPVRFGSFKKARTVLLSDHRIIVYALPFPLRANIQAEFQSHFQNCSDKSVADCLHD